MDHAEPSGPYTALDVAAIIDGSRVLLDDGRYRVIALRSASSAAWWGRGTRWCTTNPGWFQTYEQHGELVCIEDRRNSMRWQFQFWRCELRNWRNRRCDPIGFAEKHPIVMEALGDRLERDFRARYFFGLPCDGETVDHGLNLRGVPLKRLPYGLWVRDDLDVSETGIKSLPEGLRVGGDLYVSDCPTPEMPKDFRVSGVRYIRSMRLQHLADATQFR